MKNNYGMIRKYMGFLLAVVLLITACTVVFPGNVTEICNAAEKRSGVSTQGNGQTEEKTKSKPCTKEDGGKHRIAFVDYDEYMPASRQFYYILAGLEEKGWIRKGSLPFTIEDIDTSQMSTKEMYAALEKADLGEYIEFAEDGFAFLGYDDQKAVAEKYKTRAGKDIDLVLTFGTAGGLFVKELNLPVPMVVDVAHDPLQAGAVVAAHAVASFIGVVDHHGGHITVGQANHFGRLKIRLDHDHTVQVPPAGMVVVGLAAV